MPNDRNYRSWTPAERKERGLKKLRSLLTELRSIDALSEASPGIFRCEARAFLHFHYLLDGTFVADARIGGDDFQKFDVNTPAEQTNFLATLREAIG